jgi:phenylalanyl-tRNA synthetase beta subunit
MLPEVHTYVWAVTVRCAIRHGLARTVMNENSKVFCLSKIKRNTNTQQQAAQIFELSTVFTSTTTIISQQVDIRVENPAIFVLFA